MKTSAKIVAVSALASMALIGCQTASTETEAASKPDPRQGEEVSKICFSSQIRNWRELDRRSVIVEKGLNEEYRLELIGTCDPSSSFTSIGLVSRFGTGSCLSTGDKVVTDAHYNDGSCSIRRIYRWNEDAASEETESEIN